MDQQNEKIYDVLIEIRDLLAHISFCFEDQYKEILEKRTEERYIKLKDVLNTDIRKKIFPLLFDSKHLSQGGIASLAQTTQPTVSKFISELVKNDLIEQLEENGKTIYRDKYNLQKMIEE